MQLIRVDQMLATIDPADFDSLFDQVIADVQDQVVAERHRDLACGFTY